MLTGVGAPTVIPDFTRQRYLDTAATIEYIAIGDRSAAEWLPTTISAAGPTGPTGATGVTSKIVVIAFCPGKDTCDKTLATDKGWTVVD